MIHQVQLTNFDSRGLIRFSIGDQEFSARHHINPEEMDDARTFGDQLPLKLIVDCDNEVEYLPGPDASYRHKATDEGDRMDVRGRITDYLDHDAIRLDGDLSCVVKLKLPQTASDYRRGSHLRAVGTLWAALPGPDHEH